jgi:molybdopterin-guanine dinucleotide biosynthesis protein A
MTNKIAGNIAGIVLAGGRATRMGGGDKGLLTLAGRPVLAHVLSRLAPQVEKLALNANGDAARFETFGLPVVADTVEGFAGPLAGILAGMEWVTANTSLDRMVSAAADTPFLPADLAHRLLAATQDRKDAIAVACSAGRRHPVFALWPISLRASLQCALASGERKVSAFLDAYYCVEVEFPNARWGEQAVDPFFNINTPQDLAKAELMLEARAR